MKKIFVAYTFKTKDGNLGNGNAVLEIKLPPNYEDIQDIEHKIKKRYDLESVIISNWIMMER